MKLDEWQIRKNKSNKVPRSHSPDSREASEQEPEDFTPPSRSHQSADSNTTVSSKTTTGNELQGPNTCISMSSSPLEILLKSWQSGEGFNAYTQSILELDGSGISIFKYSRSSQNNLFDEIAAHVGRYEDLALAKAFIHSSFEVAPNLHNLSWNLRQWLSAYKQLDWKSFKDVLIASNLAQTLGKCMSEKGRDLVLDSIFFLVGDRHLKDHKTYLDDCHRLKVPFVAATYNYHSGEYIEILKDFRERRRALGIEPTWDEFLLDMLEWQSGSRAGQSPVVPILVQE